MRNRTDRRDFLKLVGAAGASALTVGAPKLWAGEKEKVETPKATADCMILLWMAGGMAHTETFDPKKHVPFTPGVDAKSVLSTFPAIDTAVDNIKLSQGLEKIGKVMDRGALIRTFKAADLGAILHSRHQYHWHTGYIPPQNVACPHIGAMIAKTLGPKNPDVPAFIDIAEPMRSAAETDVVKAFLTSGFLGSEHGPFWIPDPKKPAERVTPRIEAGRFANREKLYKSLVEASPIGEFAGSYQKDSLVASMEKAYRLMHSPAVKAFDLSQEPKEIYDAYNTGNFGLGCLLARRLCEAGARFIEVHYEYVPFGHWDTHDSGHKRLADLKKTIDGPIAQLVLDLEKRGLLNRTLIVLASEFSRDPLIEGKPEKPVPNQVATPAKMTEEKHYGMHAHLTSAGSVLLFGGGIKKGAVYGKTADDYPCTTVDKPVVMSDLHATLFRAMGISPKHSFEIEQRPFYVTEDGKGKPITELYG